MILILANSRFNGGLSGGDAIYESFKKYWPCQFSESNLAHIDFKPFGLCYFARLAVSIGRALLDCRRYDLVYSSSDFLPDSIPALIYKAKGNKWVAGFFLKAFKDNRLHYLSQKLVRWLIDKFADMVIVTNPTMYDIFPTKRKTWINGGIDLSLAGLSDKPKIYDAVFCGRIHPSKGIDELLEIWDLVREKLPKARLAIIGDGDLGIGYIKHKLYAKHGLHKRNGIDLLGYMGNERFEIYKQSRMVLYPTPPKYDHFSMAPVEAMACGCVMLSFNINSIIWLTDGSISLMNEDSASFADSIIDLIEFGGDNFHYKVAVHSIYWAQQFDYQKQSMRVYEDVCRLILT